MSGLLVKEKSKVRGGGVTLSGYGVQEELLHLFRLPVFAQPALTSAHNAFI